MVFAQPAWHRSASARLPIALLLLAGSLPGCNNNGSTTKPVDPTPAESVELDDSLETARDALREKADLNSCQGAVRQLNVYLNGHPEKRSTPRPSDQRGLFGLDDDEWVEVNAVAFTHLDAHHLEECFLLRDAARALGADASSPLQRARAAFAWVVRQVRLFERPNDQTPPRQVLRRGWGTSFQRSLLFLGLLRQLDLDGCLVVFPGKETISLPGVLVGQDIYLFDSRLGMPLPGAEGAVVTLAELRAHPEWLAQLSVDAEKLPYDLAPAQLGKAEIHLYCPLSALAPRMQQLQQWLRPSVKAVLAIDPTKLEQNVRAAAEKLGVPVVFPTRSGDAQAPARSLRQFLPPKEGGVDVPQQVPLRTFVGFTNDNTGLPMPRYMLLEYEMVPWRSLPALIRNTPCYNELGDRLRSMYMAFYLSHVVPPRELIQRGRFDEATRLLTSQLDELANLKEIRQSLPQLDSQSAEWMKEAENVQVAINQTQDAIKKGKLSADALDAPRKRLESMWRDSPLLTLCADALRPALTAEASYSMAICKQELAERLQVRAEGPVKSRPDPAQLTNDWQTAKDWWWNFGKYHSNHSAIGAARQMHARSQECLGNHEAARELWQNLGTGLLDHPIVPLTPLEKTACLYRARRLKMAR